MTQSTLTEYYASRAVEYELVYQKPVRQSDLLRLRRQVSAAFADLTVLEIACGTGYWTQCIARAAKSILATDINREMLDIARHKDYGPCPVTFRQADAYALPGWPDFQPTAGFHGFWWSHVPIQHRAEFLTGFHHQLPAGAPVMILENRFVAGSSTPIARQDEDGNTYQQRQLQDGTRYEVLKNFQTTSELQASLEPYADHLTVIELDYYWLAQYVTKPEREAGDLY